MNKSTSFFILLGLTLVLGLAGAIVLVRNGQDTRSSASFIKSGALVLLPATSTAKVGEEFKLNYTIQATTATVNTFQAVVCYDPANVEVVAEKTVFNAGFEPDVKEKLTINGKTCYGIVGHNTAGVTNALINVASLTFKALKVSTGSLEILGGDKTIVAGVSTVDDKQIEMVSITGASYTITAAVTTTPSISMFYNFRAMDDYRSLKLGDTIKSDIKINSYERKIKSVKAVFCSTDLLKPSLNAIVPQGKFTVVSKRDLTGNCYEVVLESNVTDLPYGDNVPLFTIETVIVKYGNGTLTINRTDSYAIDSTGLKLPVNESSGGTGFGITQIVCTDFTYSAWTACSGGNQTRTVATSLPAGCTGGTPVLSQTCTVTPTTCTSFTYSAWTACSGGNQTRTATGVPTGCTGGTPVLSQTCTVTATCTNGTKECVTTSQARECVNNAWVVANCTSVQNCVSGVCQTRSANNSAINIKMAFAGVKKGNTQCVFNWLTKMKVRDAFGNNPLTVDALVGSVPVETDSVNSKGEVIFTYKTNLIEFNSGVTTNGLSFFLTGPKHISIKYGKNNQNSWYSTLAGTLGITGGVDNNYDFSEYPLLVGDVNGDGKINGQDFSLIKEKTQPITTGPQGANLYADLDGNCQVNSGDVRLIKESLVEINSQTY